MSLDLCKIVFYMYHVYANIKCTINIPYICRKRQGQMFSPCFLFEDFQVKSSLIKINANMNRLLVAWIEIPRHFHPEIVDSLFATRMYDLFFFDHLSKTSKNPPCTLHQPHQKLAKERTFRLGTTHQSTVGTTHTISLREL